MQRLTARDCRLSDIPQICGLDYANTPAIWREVNGAQESLLYDKAAGDESWVGTWAEIDFMVPRHNPYLTCPRGVARIEAMDAARRTVPVSNQFAEYMLFGNGKMGQNQRWRGLCGNTAAFARNDAVLFSDLKNCPQQIQLFASNPADNGKRVLIQGLNQNNCEVYTQDGTHSVRGEYVTLASPYAISVNSFNYISGIQKDVTQGEVQFFQSDPIWGNSEAILTMEPSETTAWYRRYYIHNLPRDCRPCHRSYAPGTSPEECGCPWPREEYVIVSCLCKLDLIPVTCDTDYMLLQSLQAIREECIYRRLSTSDSSQGLQQAAAHHLAAVRLLIGQGQHREGKNQVSLNWRPFGSASLERVNIGML